MVFEAEVPLLELQARSIARHVPAGVFDEVLVIDNSRRGLSPSVQQRIRAELGSHAARTTFATREDLGVGASSATGWRTQQSLKLMAARRLASDHYVVLDAKNHFIERTTRADFFDARTGLPHGGSTPSSGIRSARSSSAWHPDSAWTRLPPSIASPRPHRRSSWTAGVVDELVADIGRGDPDRFPVEFERAGYTEFFLYSAWQVARGATPDDLVSGRSLVSPTVWVGACGPGDVRAVLDRAERNDTTTLAVHRRALAKLNRESVRALAEFWTGHDLFPTSDDAESFVRRFRIGYVRSMGVRRVRERSVPLTLRPSASALRPRPAVDAPGAAGAASSGARRGPSGRPGALRRRRTRRPSPARSREPGATGPTAR